MSTPDAPQPFGPPSSNPGPAVPPPFNSGPAIPAPANPGTYDQPGPYSPQNYGAPTPSTPQPSHKGGLGSLFDFTFTSFVTPTIVKIIYVIVTIVTAIAWLFVFFPLALAADPIAGFLVLFLGWIPGILELAIVRSALEMTLAAIRTAENTQAIRAKLGA